MHDGIGPGFLNIVYVLLACWLSLIGGYGLLYLIEAGKEHHFGWLCALVVVWCVSVCAILEEMCEPWAVRPWPLICCVVCGGRVSVVAAGSLLKLIQRTVGMVDDDSPDHRKFIWTLLMNL